MFFSLPLNAWVKLVDFILISPRELRKVVEYRLDQIVPLHCCAAFKTTVVSDGVPWGVRQWGRKHRSRPGLGRRALPSCSDVFLTCQLWWAAGRHGRTVFKRRDQVWSVFLESQLLWRQPAELDTCSSRSLALKKWDECQERGRKLDWSLWTQTVLCQHLLITSMYATAYMD